MIRNYIRKYKYSYLIGMLILLAVDYLGLYDIIHVKTCIRFIYAYNGFNVQVLCPSYSVPSISVSEHGIY